jgi:hypothetical protein
MHKKALNVSIAELEANKKRSSGESRLVLVSRTLTILILLLLSSLSKPMETKEKDGS